MSRLRIGTCSWRFPSWAGIVYSAAEGIDHLAEYARRYDTVEVDRWFWSLFGGGDGIYAIKHIDSAEAFYGIQDDLGEAAAELGVTGVGIEIDAGYAAHAVEREVRTGGRWWPGVRDGSHE